MQQEVNRLSHPNRISRRAFAEMLGRLGLGLAVVPLAPLRARADEALTYFTYAGYEIPQFHQSYLDSHGAESVAATLFANLDEAMQKILGGFKPDVSHSCISNVQRWREAGISYPIDVARLTHWPDVWESLRSLDVTQHDGQYWLVPFDWGNSSVIYRTDAVDAADGETWEMLFNEKYKGKISGYDSVENVIIAAIVAGVADPFNPKESDFGQVEKLLRKQRDIVRFYWSDQTVAEQALASGELVAAYAWNSSVGALRKQGIPVKYANPKEGIITWVCGLTLTDNDPGKDADRYAFIDAMLEPASGKYLIDAYGYGHANQKAFDLVGADRLAELGLSEPADFLKQGIFYKPMSEDTRQRYIEIFEKVKAGG
jgi:spermidine/putrescine transport system substrate-binding protein